MPRFLLNGNINTAAIEHNHPQQQQQLKLRERLWHVLRLLWQPHVQHRAQQSTNSNSNNKRREVPLADHQRTIHQKQAAQLFMLPLTETLRSFVMKCRLKSTLWQQQANNSNTITITMTREMHTKRHPIP